ncbi:6-phospho-beta-glucosidase [Hamadaea flava]|uniref:6-phospho-beta-glucosidase n=1 Tax=Hamadaea flava TaxID=1742688 RepID=A0ABV8LZS4_9ACTN|nr:6-phospho-beta-glucosidase [Hamadaea flava]MCP2326725.1 6-phospho-beta-glucosidase [Hamadaea flava]
MKIAVVGGGSTYTPELVDGVARIGLPVTELALIDPAADRLGVVGAFAARIFAHLGHPGRVTWTSDPVAGLSDADAVLIQLRVGGQAARTSDETFPLECGCVGQETTGAGGLAKALRTVPVVLDIAEQARRLARPHAWIVNFTNPVGIMTRALLDAGHRAVGLCNVAIGVQRRIAAHYAVDPETVRLDHFGLNHLTWVRAAHVNGVDVLPEVLDDKLDRLAEDIGFPADLVAAQRAIPSYYLRYFYHHDEEVAAARGTQTRGQAVAEIERDLLAMYADPKLVTKPELLAKRGGAFYSEAALGLLQSLHGVRGFHSVNVRNRGTLPFLPDETVVEVTAPVTPDGPAPEPRGWLEPSQRGLISHVSAYEELAVAAAIQGGRHRVYHALLAHPLVGQHDLAEKLTDRLLAANHAYLNWADA